ncbi:MAG: YqgE/AlgH family protein [Chitinophagales bacterium]|nr:YqgE/AlgH family protein [Chitinophagales bacterium]
MAKDFNIEKGDLLVAEPFMKDPSFKRTVTLICEHNTEGSIGLVLNRPSIFRVNEMIPNFPAFQSTVYYGGPVGMDRLNYIHSYGDLVSDSIHIKDNLYWNGNFEQLKTLIKERQILPHNIKFFAGYAGWEGGQLNEEMQDNSWIVSKDYPEIFKMSEYMWHDVLIKMGGKNKLLSTFPEDPILN